MLIKIRYQGITWLSLPTRVRNAVGAYVKYELVQSTLAISTWFALNCYKNRAFNWYVIKPKEELPSSAVPLAVFCQNFVILHLPLLDINTVNLQKTKERSYLYLRHALSQWQRRDSVIAQLRRPTM